MMARYRYQLSQFITSSLGSLTWLHVLQKQWDLVSERGQRTILALVLLTVIGGWVQIVLCPLQQQITYQRDALRQQQQFLQQIEPYLPLLRQYQQSLQVAQEKKKGTLSAQLQQHALRASVNVQHLQESEQGVQLTVEDLPFTQLINWLAALEVEQHLIVAQVDVRKGQEPGKVRVTSLVLMPEVGHL